VDQTNISLIHQTITRWYLYLIQEVRSKKHLKPFAKINSCSPARDNQTNDKNRTCLHHWM